jgi:tripeptide aminopeptidase
MNNLSRLIDLAIFIQQIPAPTFHEAARAEFVRARFAGENLQDVEMDVAGNVYARLPALKTPQAPDRPPVIVCAHLDTVFPPTVDLKSEREPERVLGPGIGDNSLGVAGLFGLVWALREQSLNLPGDLWLAANVGEEGLGNLRGIRAVVDRFGAEARAYVILEGMALGQVFHRGLGVRRYRIGIQTSGGHSWIDYGKPSAIHELAGISSKIAALELPRSPRTTLNIGVISGGSSVNTIAAEAMLELDLRSESAEALGTLSGQVEAIVGAAEKPGVKARLEVIGERPPGELPADHWLVQRALECLREEAIEPRLNIGSTDANLPLSLGLPAVTIGLTTGGLAHTVHEFINLAPLGKGMRQLVRLVSRAWEDS